eukprot:COSAG01_NODE_1113_length_11650_cov_59.656913_3_plen_111_part_00
MGLRLSNRILAAAAVVVEGGVLVLVLVLVGACLECAGTASRKPRTTEFLRVQWHVAPVRTSCRSDGMLRHSWRMGRHAADGTREPAGHVGGGGPIGHLPPVVQAWCSTRP